MRRSSRRLYDRYLEDPAAVEPRWRDLFRRTAATRRWRARCFAFCRAGEFCAAGAAAPDCGQHGARGAVTAQRKAVRGPAVDRRVSLSGRASCRCRSAQAPGKAADPRARSGVLRFGRGRHGDRVRHRFADRTARDEVEGHPADAAGYLLPHYRRRVHVHLRCAAEALDPGTSGNDPLDARATMPHTRSTSSNGSPRRKPWNATCTPNTSGRRAFRSKAATA